jgi:hypothetical protein
MLLTVKAMFNMALLGKHDSLSNCKIEASNDLYAL